MSGGTISFEVEQKYRVENTEALLRRFAVIGVTLGTPLEQVDTYYRHPARDYRQTDEALRIRKTEAGSAITYKGTRLDRTTKTRRELELPLPETCGGGEFAQLLEALGFSVAAQVRKRRRHGQLVSEGFPLHIVLDEVEQLGRFTELEIVTSEDQLASAKRAIGQMAERLELVNPERRSYLELLLDGK